MSSCLSRSVRPTSWTGQFGSGLRALRELLTGCRTAGRCVLMPGLSSVLEGVPNAKFAERSVASAAVAPATLLFSGSAAEDASLAIKPAQLSHTVCKQHLTSVLLPHMLCEISICRRRVSVGNCATLRHSGGTPWAFVSVWAVFWHSSQLAVAELSGLLMPQGKPEICTGSERPSSRSAELLGAESPASLIRL